MQFASNFRDGLMAKVQMERERTSMERANELRRQSNAGSKLGGGGYEGWLYKKPTKLSAYLSWSGWRRRYCVVDDDGFKYFGKQGDAEPRGQVLFSENCKVVRGGRVDYGLYGFDIVSLKDGSLHSFASNDERAIAIWADVLELKIRQASLRKTHPLRRSTASARSSLRSSSMRLDSTEGLFDEEDTFAEDSNHELTGKVPKEWLMHQVRNSNRFTSWQTLESLNGALIEAAIPSFAGNSVSDFGAWTELFWGIDEVVATTVIEASPSQLFAAVMDMSPCRANWDSTFLDGCVTKVEDLHNDQIIYCFRVPSGTRRKMHLKRYWGRAVGGSFTIFCSSVDSKSAASKTKKKGILCDVDAYQITISPIGKQSGAEAKMSKVCCRVCMSVGGWAAKIPYMNRRLSAEFIATIANLEKLFSGTKYFPFEGQLLPGIANTGLKIENCVAIVEILRKISAEKSPALLDDFEGAYAIKQEKQESKTVTDADTTNDEQPAEIEINRRYALPKNNCVLPRDISKDGTSSWWDSGTDAGYWKLRGPTYLSDKVKVPSKVSAMELVQMQWSFYPEPIRNIANHESELIQLEHEGREDREFMLVINFMVPSIGNWTSYFLRRHDQPDPKFDRLFKRFLEEDDEYRNNRFKIIPSVVDGSFIAKKGIGNTPAILGKKIKCEYFHGKNWFEVCVDIGSSKMAGSLMGLVKSYAATLVIDLAFLIESQSPDELPERLIGGARIYKPLMYPIEDNAAIAKSQEIYNAAIAPTPVPAPRPVAPKVDVSVQSASKTSIDAESVKQLPKESSAKPLTRQDSATMKKEHNASTSGLRLETTPSSMDYNYSPALENFLVKKANSRIGQSCYEDAGSTPGRWMVRGPTYLADPKKIPSSVSTMELIQTQLLFSDEVVSHISALPNGFMERQHTHTPRRPYMFVVNFMIPDVGNWVCYFAKRRGIEANASFEELFTEFIMSDDDFRNRTFKIFPSVVEGYFLASKALGNKPLLIGQHVAVDYFSGGNYFEVCIDLGKSRAAMDLFSSIRTYASSLILDIGFAIEPKSPTHLPEVILGGCRLVKPITFPMPEEDFQKQYVKH